MSGSSQPFVSTEEQSCGSLELAPQACLAAAEALVAYRLCLFGFLVLLASDTHDFCGSHDLFSLPTWASQ